MNKFELQHAVALSSLSGSDKALLNYIILCASKGGKAWISTARLSQVRGISHESNFKGVSAYLGNLVTVSKGKGRYFAKEAGVPHWTSVDKRTHGYTLNVSAILALPTQHVTVNDTPSREGVSKNDEPTKGHFCEDHERQECDGQKKDGSQCHGSSLPGSKVCRRHYPSHEGKDYPSHEGKVTLPTKGLIVFESTSDNTAGAVDAGASSLPTNFENQDDIDTSSFADKENAPRSGVTPYQEVVINSLVINSLVNEIEDYLACQNSTGSDHPSHEGVSDIDEMRTNNPRQSHIENDPIEVEIQKWLDRALDDSKSKGLEPKLRALLADNAFRPKMDAVDRVQDAYYAADELVNAW